MVRPWNAPSSATSRVRARSPSRVPVAARELQARLHRLGAAVAEERAVEARQRREPLGELALERVVEEVRAVQQRRRLLGDHRGEPRVRVTERRDADAREEVEVLAPLGVVQERAAPVRRCTIGAALVHLHHVRRFEGDDVDERGCRSVRSSCSGHHARGGRTAGPSPGRRRQHCIDGRRIAAVHQHHFVHARGRAHPGRPAASRPSPRSPPRTR